ncbi:MAG: hypothetical protein DCO96_14680 [Fluviicola sp. XM-24bin1]|nr:MAG: hypothetical protein DCO96_14680 [Fluviicola sp. XM-24bin1]
MLKHLAYTLFIVLLLISCEKAKFEGDFERVKGDYDWMYSGEGSSAIYSGMSPEKYGIRITDNSKLIFFKNGKEERRFRILEVKWWHDNQILLRLKTKSGEPNIAYLSEDNVFKIFLLPFRHEEGYFKKKQ